MSDADKKIIAWLLTGCVLICLMVIVGGITRLTGSGLSITRWKLIHGTVPPLNEAQWQEEFEQYKRIPQFRHLNYGFTLEDFKGIYWWEYIHRLLGRLIGLVFVVPFAWFYFTGRLRRPLAMQLLALFALGGLQGFLGWFMVRSGLSENLHVSHLRLALHLLTAMLTFGFTLWIALGIAAPVRTPASDFRKRLGAWAGGLLALVIVQVIFGAFVAGLKAGYLYNTFPKMGDAWIPDAVATAGSPGSWFDSPARVQFVHRGLAWLLLLAVIVFRIRVRRDLLPGVCTAWQRAGARAIVAGVGIQFLLGVLTILYGVPPILGVAHQAGAFFVFGAVLFFRFSLYRVRPGDPGTLAVSRAR